MLITDHMPYVRGSHGDAVCLHHDEHRHGVRLVTQRRVTDMEVSKNGRVRVVPWQSHRHERWLQKASYRMNARKESRLMELDTGWPTQILSTRTPQVFTFMCCLKYHTARRASVDPGMFKAWKSFSSVSSALAVISALRP
jgi:hypothetical protein